MFGLYLIVTVCMIICPISALAVIIAVCLNYSILNRTYWSYLIFSLLGILCFYVGYKLAMPVIPFLVCREYAARILSFMNIQAEHVDLRTYIISDLRTIGLCMFIEMVALYMTTRTPEVIMMDKERRRENEKLRVQKIDYIPKRSQLIVGVSGAGKTAYISKSIEEILNKDPTAFIVIVDGKGSTEKYSLYYSCKLIARNMKQKLFII